MDTNAFARLSRHVAATPSRRAALGLGVATVLGALGVDGARAVRRCKTCERRMNNGRCRRERDGAPCAGKPCCACGDGYCRERDPGVACNGDGRCLHGVCNRPPTCLPAGSSCPGDCCSGVCWIGIGQATGVCDRGADGTECLRDGDCQSGTCVAYRCA